MEKQAYRKSLDLQKNGTQWSVDEKYLDTNSREIIISLTDGGKPYYVDEDINVTVYSSTGAYVECRVESGSIIFEPTRAFLANVGTINCELRLVSSNSKGSQLLTSPRFDIVVYDILANEQSIIDTDDYSALVSETVKSIEATKRANDIAETLETKLANGEFKGAKGDTGAQGIQGVKGDKGDTGPQGIQGVKGDKGDTGPQGAQGVKGEKGDTGPQGVQGPKGEKGDTGLQGVQGAKGDKGDPGTTDYTKLANNPFTLITVEDFDGSKLEDGHNYLIAQKSGTRISFGATFAHGSQILVDGETATVISGIGTFFIQDISDPKCWEASDYCPALSEVENMISSIDMTDIDVSQALVKFKSIDNVNLSLTLKEFAEAMMQYFQTYDSQITAKQDKITLGDGLKWQNGKLCLDIENGDNLKYGTSTAQAEVINENEVVTNE